MPRFQEIEGLRDFWAGMIGGAPVSPPVPLRPLFDTLGLGLEQAISHCGRERPDWDAFVAWILSTAGKPDPAALSRYGAWYRGEVAPEAERVRQAAVMATAPVFSDAEIATWERDGVIVLRNAIAPDDAAAIATHLWTLKGATPDDPTSWYGGREGGIMVQQFQHPAMDVPRRALRVHRAFAQLYGHADLIASCDRLSFNPPVTKAYAFPGPDLHWDTNLASPIPFETQGILYLTDTAGDQGALRVVPGFHHRLLAWLESLDGRNPRDVDLADEAVAIAGGAGDLVIWRQELPHGASANLAKVPRMAQYVNLYPMHRSDTRAWI